ncbi:MAG: hypothetical protein QM753_15870 [Thermomicrobiales bacterium]
MVTTVRVDDALAATLRSIAVEEQRPMGQVIADAIAHYQRERFWRDVEESVERLRADPEAWADYQAEVRSLEGGSMDGLTDEEPYFTAEEVEDILARHASGTQGR